MARPRHAKLWPHQTAAVEHIEEYLGSGSPGSALIHMPTGSGKTGVIAVASRGIPAVNDALLLTPRRALRTQLAADVRGAFWDKIKVKPAQFPKQVIELQPSTLAADLNIATPTVFVSTFQALGYLRRTDPATFARLGERITAIFVDEGHYEPGPDWSASVRGLGKPSVLLSATPYRNDLQLFAIDPDHIFSFSYQDAVKNHFLREVSFQAIPASRSVQEFVTSLLAFYDGDFRQLCPLDNVDHAKVMVRCDTEASVSGVAAELHRQGRQVVAIHDNYPVHGSGYKHRSVPDPRSSSVPFWVHQYKLMEGVDDARFALLALYEPLGNARSLVQQVGRVLRVADRRRREHAYVLADPRSDQEGFWRNYVEFEKHGHKAIVASFGEDPLASLAAMEPVLSYALGNFRAPFDPDTTDLEYEVLLRSSSRVLHPGDGFDDDACRASILADGASNNRRTLADLELPDGTWLHLYVAYSASPLLRTQLFVDRRLGYTVFRRSDDLVFYHDSQSRVPDYLNEHTRPASARELHRLLSKTTRLVAVHLANSGLEQYSISAKKVYAHDIAGTAPAINDFAYLPRSAEVVTPNGRKQHRRRVGFGRASLSDSTRPDSVGGFRLWTDQAAANLHNTRLAIAEPFDRFAELTTAPPDPTPRNVLMDLTDVQDDYRLQDLFGEPLEIAATCVPVTRGRFRIVANGQRMTGELAYEPEHDRYRIACDGLERNYASIEGGPDLVSHLNAEQAFRVVPKSSHHIYSRYSWFSPRVPARGMSGPWADVLQVLLPDPILGSAKTEKGVAAPKGASDAEARRYGALPDGSGWRDSSLFGMIDRRRSGNPLLQEMLRNLDLLVCDDMANEAADFIGVDTVKRRVIFMHLKAYKEAKQKSASAFQEVCAQAVKNMDYLHPYGARQVPNLGMWDKAWTAPRLGIVKRRIRTGQTKARAWAAVQEAVHDPMAEREVWVVMGGGFNRSAFEKRVRAKKESPQDIQILYLVRSTWSSVASIGARLRIVCS